MMNRSLGGERFSFSDFSGLTILKIRATRNQIVRTLTYLVLCLKMLERFLKRFPRKNFRRKRETSYFPILGRAARIFECFVRTSLFTLSLSLSIFCPCNALGTFADRYSTIVIPPFSEIPSKITADRGFTSPGENGGKEMTG